MFETSGAIELQNMSLSMYVMCSTKPHFPLLLTCLSQLLVQREADLFVENDNRETPCDCAEKQHHQDLALCLESQMVFSLAPEADGIEAEYAALDRREVQSHTLKGSRYGTCVLSRLYGDMYNIPNLSIRYYTDSSTETYAGNECLLLSLHILTFCIKSVFINVFYC